MCRSSRFIDGVIDSRTYLSVTKEPLTILFWVEYYLIDDYDKFQDGNIMFNLKSI